MNAPISPASDNGTSRRRRLLQIGVAAVVVVAVAAGAFVWWFLRDDAPDEVSLETAAQVLDDDSDGGATTTAAPVTTQAAAVDTDDGAATTTAAPATTGAPAAAEGIEGEWLVNTELGEFSFEDSTGSFVGFRVEEELSSIGSATAVGRTPGVSGSIVIEGTTLVEAFVEADMTILTTNDSRRDSRARGALETDEFPTAQFELLAPIDLGPGAADGEAVAVDATGTLTVHGVSNEVTFAVQAQLIDGVVVVVGSTDIVFADYGVAVPTAPIVVSADEFGVIEMQLLFTRP